MSIRLSDRTLAEIRRQNKIGQVMPSDVVELLIQQIEQMRAAQCWAIVTIETGVIDGPYATKEAAEHDRLTILQDKPEEPMFRVEPWKGGAA